MKRILIHSTNWIGDAIITTPAIHLLRKKFPEAEIDILARRWVAPVFENNPDINEIITVENPPETSGISGAIRSTLYHFKNLRELGRRKKYELSVLFPNSFRSALEARITGARRILGYDGEGRSILLTDPVRRRPEARRVHEVYYYLWLLEKIARQEGKPALRLFVSEREIEKAREMLDKEFSRGRMRPGGEYSRTSGYDGELLVGLNPGATYGLAKRWLPERFAKVADLLAREKNARIVILGSAAEKKEAEEILEKMEERRRAISLAGRTDLRELFATVSCLSLLVTNDSGTMHVAAALGVPLVAIFGSTNPVTTAPFSERAIIVRNAPPCSPCLERTCPLEHHECMKNVTVEMVFKAAERLLGRTGFEKIII